MSVAKSAGLEKRLTLIFDSKLTERAVYPTIPKSFKGTIDFINSKRLKNDLASTTPDDQLSNATKAKLAPEKLCKALESYVAPSVSFRAILERY
ncbi:hypothetical protein SMMN14_03188 [Sphaerulina musiva]